MSQLRVAQCQRGNLIPPLPPPQPPLKKLWAGPSMLSIPPTQENEAVSDPIRPSPSMSPPTPHQNKELNKRKFKKMTRLTGCPQRRVFCLCILEQGLPGLSALRMGQDRTENHREKGVGQYRVRKRREETRPRNRDSGHPRKFGGKLKHSPTSEGNPQKRKRKYNADSRASMYDIP